MWSLLVAASLDVPEEPLNRTGHFRGLRVTVWDVLDMLACGMSETEILEDYPYLEKADFPAVYAYASQSGRERASHWRHDRQC